MKMRNAWIETVEAQEARIEQLEAENIRLKVQLGRLRGVLKVVAVVVRRYGKIVVM
jgi:hypothetical protein